jgi:pyrroloquinoline quinone biosynthesis protein E
MYKFKLDFPVPKPDIKRYNDFLQKGFQRFPERKENYKMYKNVKKSSNVNYLPIKADIENVSRCNLRCSHCLMSTFKNQKRADDLTFDDFKSFIDEQYGLIEIKMQGIGEPFLHKDFIKMVEYATEKNIWIRTTTNGMLLHKNENYKRIIDANIGEIQVSIDGATQKTQELIRINSKLDVILKNCKLLNDYGQSKGIDFTRMWTVLQNKNLHESKELIILAKEIGFNRLTFSIELREWENNDVLNKTIKQNRINNLINQDWIDDHLEFSDKVGIELTFWHATERFTKDNICMWPFERILLSSDREIVPCCIIADPSIFTFGKYIKGKFKEIWNGEEYINFRKAHLEGNIPEICKPCYY